MDDGKPAEPAEPVEVVPESLIQEIETAITRLRDRSDTSRAGLIQSALQVLGPAAASPSAAMDLYRDAYRAIHFDGASKESSLYQAWRKKEAARHKEMAFQRAAQLHAQYLIVLLTALKAEPDSNEPLKILRSYVSMAEGLSENAVDWKCELAANPAPSVVIAQYLQIAPFLGELKNWCLTPGDLDGMWTQTLLPALRILRSQEAVAYWDRRIDSETLKASQSNLTSGRHRFATVVLPRLQWSRAQEIVAIGRTTAGLKAMLAILNAFPTHPDFDKWVDEITQRARPSAPAAP